jgi:hypothetical protein
MVHIKPFNDFCPETEGQVPPEMLLPFYQNIRRQCLEDHNLHIHNRDGLQSHKFNL